MKCPICDKKTATLETVNEEAGITLRIKQCKECGFKFVTKEEVTCMAINLARRRWIGKKKNKDTCSTCGKFRECNTVTKRTAKHKNYPCWEKPLLKTIEPKNCCDNCTFKDECEEDVKATAKEERYWCWNGDVA